MSKNSATQKRELISNQIRRHVRECGLSCYAIAKATDVSESALSRFLSGKRGISAKALDQLGRLLDLQIIRHGPH